MTIAVSLVGGNEILREGLARLLGDQDIVIQSSVDETSALDPNPGTVVVLNVRGSGTVSADCAAIRSRCPNARIVALIEERDQAAIAEIISAGADQCLVSSIKGSTLAAAIRFAAVDREWLGSLSQRPAEKAKPAFDPAAHGLTKREAQILELMAQGDSNQTIGDKVGIGVGTVKVHIGHILAKLNVMNRTQVAVLVAGKAPAPAHAKPTSKSLKN